MLYQYDRRNKMNENFKITVELTSKDVKEFCFYKVYKSIFRKIYLAVTALITLSVFYGICILLPHMINSSERIMLILFTVLPLLFIIYINISPVLTLYMIHKTISHKGNFQIYEFTDESINVSALNSRYNLRWHDVFMIQELKSCFLIYYSPQNFFIIPRRCLDNNELTNKFYNTLVSRIDKNKLKLKRHKIRNISTSHNDSSTISKNISPVEFNDSQSIGEISFSFLRHEISKSYYRIYYTRPPQILSTGIGVFFLFLFFKVLIYSNERFFGLLVLGIFLIFAPHLAIHFNINKHFKKDIEVNNSYVYKFYTDYFSIKYPNRIKFIKWNDLIKVTELKSAFLLYESQQFVHILPKRAFENKEDLLEIFKKHLKSVTINRLL